MKSSTRRRSFKTKQLQPKTNICNPLVRYRPTAYVRNGIIGGGSGPGANGLYQIDDRVYTTSKMFLRDGYMYPRQPGQPMDPRFPLELHEFPQQFGATGLQLVTTPKVHIAGEYLASDQQQAEAQEQQQANAERRGARQAAAADINLANQVYWLGKQRSRSRSRSRSNSLGNKSITSCISGGGGERGAKDRPYIRNVDDLLSALGKREGNTDNQLETGSTHTNSSMQQQRRRFKKVSPRLGDQSAATPESNLSGRVATFPFAFNLIAATLNSMRQFQFQFQSIIHLPHTHTLTYRKTERSEACNELWWNPSWRPPGRVCAKIKINDVQNFCLRPQSAQTVAANLAHTHTDVAARCLCLASHCLLWFL